MSTKAAKTHQGIDQNKIPLSVWVLGFVTFLMNTSAIMIFSLFPIHLDILGHSKSEIGAIEAGAELIALATRIISGVVSDWLRKRKLLIVISYGIMTVVRPLFSIATSINGIVTARFFDRIGNGLQATPRDALVADLAPAKIKGACFGLRESLGKAGSFFGAILTFLLMKGIFFPKLEYLQVFKVAIIPTILAFILLVIFVKDPKKPEGQTKAETRKPITVEDFLNLPKAYWMLLCVIAIYALSRCGESFLILRGKDLLPNDQLEYIPLIMVCMNLTVSMASLPVGYLSDKIDRKLLIILALVIMIIAKVVLAMNTSLSFFVVGVLLWGIQYGMVQSLFLSSIADTVPANTRGTAIGIYHLTVGVFLFASGWIGGWIWDTHGFQLTFYIASFVTFLAMLLLVTMRKKSSSMKSFK